MMNPSYYEYLFQLVNIPVHAYSRETGELRLAISKDGADAMTGRNLRQELLRAVTGKKEPVLYSEDDSVFYTVFCTDTDNWILGPFCFMNEHAGAVSVTMDQACVYTALVCREAAGMDIDPGKIYLYSPEGNEKAFHTDFQMEKYELWRSEQGQSHAGMEYEQQLLEIIRTGDTEALQKLMQGKDMPPIEQVSPSFTRQMEYLVVTMIAMFSRTSVEGGLSPEIAFNMSDVYLLMLEKCRTLPQIMTVGNKAAQEYCEKVKEARENNNRNFIVEACKDYIAKNLRRPLKVGEIGPAIGVTSSYLSRKFSETEGKTIQQYLTEERCRHAANMLVYSDIPIARISEYFCFSSQSHFGRQFQKYFGVTPNQYRLQKRYPSSSRY